MPAPGLPAPTPIRRLDIASYKKAINAYQPRGVTLMHAYSVADDFGDPTSIAYFAGSDVPGGDFETLVVRPWLTGPVSAGGLGQTPIQATATIALLRTNTAIIQVATAAGAAATAATFAKVANTGAYADLAGLPAAADIVTAGMAVFLASLPTTQPTAAGVLWMNGGVLQISQVQGS